MGKLLCVLFALLAAVRTNGAGVEMGVQMLDLERMQQDLVEADEGNAQALNQIQAYGNGHVDHLEQLSRELEMEDSARAHVGAMLQHESNHFNQISAEDPRDVRMRARKEESMENDLLSRLDREIAQVHARKVSKSKKVAHTKPPKVRAPSEARNIKKAHQKAVTKAVKVATSEKIQVIDDTEDQGNAIIRLHEEEQQQAEEDQHQLLGEAAPAPAPAEMELAEEQEPQSLESQPAAEEATAPAPAPPADDAGGPGNGSTGDDTQPGEPSFGGGDPSAADGSDPAEAPVEPDADGQGGRLKAQLGETAPGSASTPAEAEATLGESKDPAEAEESEADDHGPEKSDGDGIANHHKAHDETTDPVTEHSEPKSHPNRDANSKSPKTEEDGVPDHYKEDDHPPEATKAKPVSAFSADWSFGNFLHSTS